MEDILKRGISLVGNGAKIEGMGALVESKTKIFCRLVEGGDMAIIKGCGELVQNRKLLEQIKLVSKL